MVQPLWPANLIGNPLIIHMNLPITLDFTKSFDQATSIGINLNLKELSLFQNKDNWKLHNLSNISGSERGAVLDLKIIVG